MRQFGKCLICLGFLLLAAAVGFNARLQHLEKEAAHSAELLYPQVLQQIEQNVAANKEPKQPEVQEHIPAFLIPEVDESEREMPQAYIDGYGYIGFLSIPALGLDLPVMGDWSYPQLNIAPCRYAGSLYKNNLVLMAHNYERHFGQISKLSAGDVLYFTDMDGYTASFEVVALDILPPTAIEEMTAGDYDLTCFTCTYGGQSRVTLRCNKTS